MATTTLKLDLTPWRVACISRALDACRAAEVRDAAAELRVYYGRDLIWAAGPDDGEALAVTAKLSWPRAVIDAFTAELEAALPGLAEGDDAASGCAGHGTGQGCGSAAAVAEIEAVITEIGMAVSATDEVIAGHRRTGTPYIREDGSWEPGR